MELLRDAVQRRDARRLLEEMVVMNRATNPSEETWSAMKDELTERMHTGLTKLEPPPRDPNARPPRPRPIERASRKRK